MSDELSDRDLPTSVSTYRNATVCVTRNGEPTRVDAISTACALFGVPGVKPFIGRL